MHKTFLINMLDSTYEGAKELTIHYIFLAHPFPKLF
jgi:hypothetical protein